MRKRASLLAFVVGTAAVASAQEDAALRHAREILRRAPLVDTHNDLPWLIRESAGSDIAKYDLRQRTPHETDIPRLRQGQVAAQFWSVWVPSVESGSARLQLEQVDLARRMIAAYPDDLVFATRSADIESARRAGKIASFLGGENGRAFENSRGAGLRLRGAAHAHGAGGREPLSRPDRGAGAAGLEGRGPREAGRPELHPGLRAGGGRGRAPAARAQPFERGVRGAGRVAALTAARPRSILGLA